MHVSLSPACRYLLFFSRELFALQVQQVGTGGAPRPPGAAPPSTQQDAEMLRKQRHKKFNMIAFGLSAVVIVIGVLISYFSIAAPIDDPKELAEELAKAFNAEGAKKAHQEAP